MIFLRHRSASGDLTNTWGLLKTERAIDVLLRRGNKTIGIQIAVCLPDTPRMGAHPILRRDEETWEVLPSRFVRTWPGGIEMLVPFTDALDERLSPGDHLMLTNTPEDVSVQILGFT